MLRRAQLVLVSVLCLVAASPMRAQDTTTAPDSSTLKVFLDCNYYCDFDYFRSELTAVNWVRTRQSADVQVLVTTQQTGSGGTEYTMAFIGLGRLASMVDTMRYVAPPNASSDDVRKGMLQVIRVGLVRYVAHVAGYERLQISLGAPHSDTSTAMPKAPPRDPWHAWVFSISTNGFANGEELSSSLSTYTTASATRVTEAWKTSIAINNNYTQNRFTLDSVTKYLDIQRGNGLDVRQVKSVSSHWSAGLALSLGSSTYLNQKLTTYAAPEIEYDLFPYSESTRRQLRIDYMVGVERFVYDDTTIYFRTAETLMPHEVDVAYSTRQPWGSVSLGGSWRQYLDWGSKHEFNLNTGTSLNLFRGFQLQIAGGYTQLRDQIYLPDAGYTAEEALTRQQQLATGYQYFVSLGLSYSFGSIYNNVVNPRFGNSGNGTMMMIMN